MIKDTFEPFYINQGELADLVSKFLAEGNFRPSTAKTYKSGLIRFLDYHSSNKFGFTVEDTNLYLSHLKSQSISPAAVYSYFSSIRNFFTYLVRKRIINKNPAKRITFKYIKSKQAELKIAPSYIDILLKKDYGASFHALRNKAILYLLSYHGLNVKELCALSAKDVYYYAGKVYCRRTGNENIKIEGVEKQYLLDYIRQRKSINIELPHLFLSKNLKGISPLTINGANKIIAAYAREVQKISGLDIKPSALKSTKH